MMMMGTAGAVRRHDAMTSDVNLPTMIGAALGSCWVYFQYRTAVAKYSETKKPENRSTCLGVLSCGHLNIDTEKLL
jgi:hypothetical protein